MNDMLPGGRPPFNIKTIGIVLWLVAIAALVIAIWIW